MSASHFKVVEHAIPCQSIREYPHAVRADHPPLRLAVKQYIPLNNPNPSPDDLTIIAGHANGIPKECYEPIWDELLALTKVKVKAIWIADCSHQGASGILNESVMSDDPNWFDHSRDLLHMVNHFRDQIHPPIMGIAHSFSCSQFVHLSIMHPRLFHSLAFLEPMVQVENPSKRGGRSPSLWASSRPDQWPSQADAEKFIRSSAFWRKWDPRVVDRYIRFGLRPLPTALYPDSSSDAVTLTTTKAQEAWTYLRFNATPQRDNSDSGERFLGPDVAMAGKDGDMNNRQYVTTSPWPCIAFEFLPYVRPAVLFVFGEKSHINVPDRRRDKLQRTGKGLGVLRGATHMVPLEKVADIGRLLSDWLEAQHEAFWEEREFFRTHDSGKSEQGTMALSSLWVEHVKKPVDTKREKKSRL
ncbi:toxin biosynthesis protein [Aspergillus heteromorphus CBS 117.55]|uniref:Toxin biosynthesis protein n=1 Tax=Aspergillus heteromorphus CBS 117.55 TaxID=1448321 RepID=A0A317WU51_9EURO|nr:toxin biosynthesis protein [Aspergillus heteromorphus CBS 117.55]PWY89351.1 toxin biosynthesis protein [Aspergillus heteromorphus CBS 117.55]